MTKDLAVRFRVDFGGGRSIGIGKIELLEGIAAADLCRRRRCKCDELSQSVAAPRDLNTSFDQSVARASTGGRAPAPVLTPFGELLIAGYRKWRPASAACRGVL